MLLMRSGPPLLRAAAILLGVLATNAAADDRVPASREHAWLVSELRKSYSGDSIPCLEIEKRTLGGASPSSFEDAMAAIPDAVSYLGQYRRKDNRVLRTQVHPLLRGKPAPFVGQVVAGTDVFMFDGNSTSVLRGRADWYEQRAVNAEIGRVPDLVERLIDNAGGASIERDSSFILLRLHGNAGTVRIDPVSMRVVEADAPEDGIRTHRRYRYGPFQGDADIRWMLITEFAPLGKGFSPVATLNIAREGPWPSWLTPECFEPSTYTSTAVDALTHQPVPVPTPAGSGAQRHDLTAQRTDAPQTLAGPRASALKSKSGMLNSARFWLLIIGTGLIVAAVFVATMRIRSKSSFRASSPA